MLHKKLDLEIYILFFNKVWSKHKKRLLDRNHNLVTFFVGSIDKKTSQERRIGLEHLIGFWNDGNQNEAIRFIKKNGTILIGELNIVTRNKFRNFLKCFLLNRKNWKIKEVFEFVLSKGLLFNKKLTEFIERLSIDSKDLTEEEKDRQTKDKMLYDTFMDLPYKELLKFGNMFKTIQYFRLKHGTKGEEFRNVLSVIDDTQWAQQ